MHAPSNLPAFLAAHAVARVDDPRAAALAWFRSTRFGLFLHYGLYSLLAGEWPGARASAKGSEWIRWWAPIPFDRYVRLRERFTAERFDADAICRLARAAGMGYVNLTAQHHDGFCLWDTATCDFSSPHAPARRDLVAELTAACARHGLGCFLYYSHGRDWWHPDAPQTGPDVNGYDSTRTDCPEDRARFHYGDEIDLDAYLDLVEAQVLELCAYPAVAGIWLDGIGTFKQLADGVARSRCRELYDKIHATSPHILVAYKQGLTHTEDFYAPEREIRDGSVPQDGRPYEICTTLQPTSWGHRAADDGRHRDADWVMARLAEAAAIPANLLLNAGPLGDGSIHPEDEATLREVGRRLREEDRPCAAL